MSGLEMQHSPASISLILLLLSFTTSYSSRHRSAVCHAVSLCLSVGLDAHETESARSKPHFLTDQVMDSGSRGVKRESRRLIGPVGALSGGKKMGGKKAVEETDGGVEGHK